MGNVVTLSPKTIGWERIGLMKESICENQCDVTLLCIDGYERGVLSGRMYHPYFGAGIQINSAMDFLKKLEFMLETVDIPRSNYKIRTFCPLKKADIAELSRDELKRGKRATFALRFLFRQNASWQGTIIWSEGKQEKNFRSVLELLLLMDSVLGKNAIESDKV